MTNKTPKASADYILGLKRAIKEIERLHDQAVWRGCVAAYICAFSESFVFLSAMVGRLERGEPEDSVSSVEEMGTEKD